jgi:hypothetical protein
MTLRIKMCFMAKLCISLGETQIVNCNIYEIIFFRARPTRYWIDSDFTFFTNTNFAFFVFRGRKRREGKGRENGEKGMERREWREGNGEKGMERREWREGNGEKGMERREWREGRNGEKGNTCYWVRRSLLLISCKYVRSW